MPCACAHAGDIIQTHHHYRDNPEATVKDVETLKAMVSEYLLMLLDGLKPAELDDPDQACPLLHAFPFFVPKGSQHSTTVWPKKPSSIRKRRITDFMG